MKRKKRRIHTGAKARRNRRLVILSGIVAALASAFVLGMVLFVIFGMNKGEDEDAEDVAIFEASFAEPVEELYESEYISPDTIRAIVDGGKSVADELSKRPATVEMTADSRASFATISECHIVDGGKVQIDVTSPGIPKSDDKYYYLFEEATYQDAIPEGAEPLSKI